MTQHDLDRAPTVRSRAERSWATCWLVVPPLLLSTALAGMAHARPPEDARQVFRAGAHAIDISPRKLPAIINGNFLQNTAAGVNDPLLARCLVLDDGAIRLAIAIVDSCMMPRDLLDRAKRQAAERTGIPPERILIAATHTHSAPSAMGALGTPPDPDYVAFLPERLAEGIAQAAANLAPARAGWGAVDDHEHTFCRRWIRRPDKMIDDPFGNRTVRANMHPGYQNPDAIAPSGPVDPALTLLSIQTSEGRPLAVLANYSQHYFGSSPVSADYFGRFARALARRIGAEQGSPPFVGIMSQGTSGDQMWMDYGSPKKDPGLDRYAEEVAETAYRGYKAITGYQDRVPLAMAETTLVLDRRVPDPDRLAWARKVAAEMGDRLPRNLPEVYAREAIALHEDPRRELRLQAIRVGGLGIAAIPNEVFALTGLKIKARSPFATTMNIELANGSEGYIPPPEQHALGGYTTWPARTAALEVEAEPRIVETVLTLLERVAGVPRKAGRPGATAYSEQVLAARPLAYWRLDDMDGTSARDATGREGAGTFERGIALFLPGPELPGLGLSRGTNRAVHLAGGRILASLETSPEAYSVEFWFWNGLPNDARPMTGNLFARASDASHVEVLGLGGTAAGTSPGRLFVSGGPGAKALSGKTEIRPKTWHHLVLVREGTQVSVHLDGNETPEIRGQLGPGHGAGLASFFLGGRQDREETFEGKVDEVAIYGRPLAPGEIASHFRAAVQAPASNRP
ncbi:MAG: LamG domain-containing protein [Isosphaeraceae bacterium]